MREREEQHGAQEMRSAIMKFSLCAIAVAATVTSAQAQDDRAIAGTDKRTGSSEDIIVYGRALAQIYRRKLPLLPTGRNALAMLPDRSIEREWKVSAGAVIHPLAGEWRKLVGQSHLSSRFHRAILRDRGGSQIGRKNARRHSSGVELLWSALHRVRKGDAPWR